MIVTALRHQGRDDHAVKKQQELQEGVFAHGFQELLQHDSALPGGVSGFVSGGSRQAAGKEARAGRGCYVRIVAANRDCSAMAVFDAQEAA